MQDKEPKFQVKKRTKSGRYITVAEGDTRNEVIENLKRDSETYREREDNQNEQEIH